MNKTGYFSHPDCKKHEMGAGHPECPERLDAIEDRLLATGVGDALDRREAPLADVETVALAHDPRHVAGIRELARELGVKLQYVESSFPQLVGDVSAGRCDVAMFAVGITPQRQQAPLGCSPRTRTIANSC